MNFKALHQNYQPVDLSELQAMATPQAVRQQGTRGRGGTLTSFISEGGALGGAAAGATAGSVVPIIGTAIGGLIGAGLGAFGGRLAENKVRDDRWGVGDAAKEGALTSVLAGPLRLGKYAASGAKGLRAGAGLEAALASAADDAAKVSIRGAIGKKAAQKSSDMAIRGFKFTPSQLTNFKKKFGEDASETIARHGLIGGSADDFTAIIGKLNQSFDNLVATAGTIKKADVQSMLKKEYTKLIKSAPTDTKRLGGQVKSEVDSLLKQFGDEISAPELNSIRRMFDDLVTYTNKAADPARYGVNKRIADALRKSIQKASGSDELKNTGIEINKLRQLADSVALQGNRGRGASPIGLSTIIAGGAGGVGAGLPGALVMAGAERAVNSPLALKLASRSSQAVGNKLTQSATQAGPIRNALAGATRGTLAVKPAGTLVDVLTGAQDNYSLPQSSPMIAPRQANPSNSNISSQQYTQSGQMSSDIPQSSPYPLENALYDIQRDPRHADYYMNLFEFANQGGQAGMKLQNTAIARISDFESGIKALDGLEQNIVSSGVNQPFIGDLRRRNPFDTEAQDLNSSIRSVRQLVGRALEGGVLRREDEIKYEQMLPKIGDTDAVARAKIANVRQLLASNLQAFMQNQAQYGGGGGSLEAALMQTQQAY